MLTKGRLAAQEITLAQHHKNRAAVVAMLEAYAEFPPLLKKLSVDWFSTYEFFGLDCLPYAKRRGVVEAMMPEGVLDDAAELKGYGLQGLSAADQRVYHFIAYARLRYPEGGQGRSAG